MTSHSYAVKCANWVDEHISSTQKRLEQPPVIKRYRFYGKSLMLPMAVMSVNALFLLVLMLAKLLFLPAIYNGVKKDGAD